MRQARSAVSRSSGPQFCVSSELTTLPPRCTLTRGRKYQLRGPLLGASGDDIGLLADNKPCAQGPS